MDRKRDPERPVRPDGAVDRPDHPLFAAILRAALEGRTGAVVVDLSRVRTVTADGMRGLLDCVRSLRTLGGTLYLAAAPEAVARLLRLTLVGTGVGLFPTVTEAQRAAAAPGSGTAPGTERAAAAARETELERLRRETADLRGKLRSHPLIAQAQGILLERYRLAGPETAFTLLKESSQAHNVKLRTLAAALVAVPRPAPGSAWWFPGRVRRPAPPLPLLPEMDNAGANRGAVVKRVLHQALETVGSGMGDLQLVDPARRLRMEQHHGFDQEFIDYFAVVGEGETPCALAAERARPVVSDIATDRVFSAEARDIVLATGSRTVHSFPMTGGSGQVVGVFSLHVTETGRSLAAGEERILAQLAAQGGAWLEWHEQTVLRDALEHLHQRARRDRGTPSAASGPPHG
ncbi:ANTAR domain-containing protein [Streptomyces sp. NEAU-Y11]|uniref:ANTAR domain-containing protein n=1 Tax=Streptomyces cucumeris TaxID=2962890 RepID=UPI0020C88157|nr:ANTAR domain-containing protein [Streptomyces sp. NEAU-Y11]MCP9207864.1 ANTAR domain-containing protein [Streptomyces sp. NEAU-Y11]